MEQARRSAGQRVGTNGIKAAGRRGSSEDDLPLPLNRAPDLGDGRGLNPSPDEHRPAANRSMTHSFTALQPGEPDEARKAPLYRGFRRRRAASERQLAQRKRRVAKPQPATSRSLRQRASPAALERARPTRSLLLGRAARAHEVRVVRVREPVRARLRRAPPRPAPRARARRRSRPPRRARPRSASRPSRTRPRDVPVEDAQLHAGPRRDRGEELGALERRRPHLEVRRPRPGQRAAAEQRAAQVRARGSTPARRLASAAARAAHGGRRRRRPRGAPASARLVSVDVQLVARRPFERVPLVRPDLRRRRRARAGG